MTRRAPHRLALGAERRYVQCSLVSYVMERPLHQQLGMTDDEPSAVEQYEGAATGVGGIIRDIFSMGARPIALMDPLRFGSLDDARTRYLFEGVVSGISGYGNSVGVPTVGGEAVFDDTYRDNPLGNVLCLGVLPRERLVLALAG